MTTNATKNIRCFSVVFYLKMFNMRCAVFIGSSAIRQDRSSIDQWLFIVIVFECCKQFCENTFVCVCFIEYTTNRCGYTSDGAHGRLITLTTEATVASGCLHQYVTLKQQWIVSIECFLLYCAFLLKSRSVVPGSWCHAYFLVVPLRHNTHTHTFERMERRIVLFIVFLNLCTTTIGQ